MNIVRVKKLEESVIHGITKLSDFDHTTTKKSNSNRSSDETLSHWVCFKSVTEHRFTRWILTLYYLHSSEPGTFSESVHTC